MPVYLGEAPPVTIVKRTGSLVLTILRFYTLQPYTAQDGTIKYRTIVVSEVTTLNAEQFLNRAKYSPSLTVSPSQVRKEAEVGISG